MKYLSKILFSFYFLASSFMYSQVLNDSGQHGRMQIQTKKNNSLNSVQGSPFLNENFQKGTVTIGDKIIDVLLRYDVVNEVMEIKTRPDDEDIYLLPSNSNNDTKYTIGPEKFAYRTLKLEDELVEGYFREHFSGEKVNLLEKFSANITDPVKAQTGYQKDKPARIVMEERFFLVMENAVEEVRLKTKDFKKALPDSRVVNSYLSENKVKSIEDFTKMLEWYDIQ